MKSTLTTVPRQRYSLLNTRVLVIGFWYQIGLCGCCGLVAVPNQSGRSLHLLFCRANNRTKGVFNINGQWYTEEASYVYTYIWMYQLCKNCSVPLYTLYQMRVGMWNQNRKKNKWNMNCEVLVISGCIIYWFRMLSMQAHSLIRKSGREGSKAINVTVRCPATVYGQLSMGKDSVSTYRALNTSIAILFVCKCLVTQQCTSPFCYHVYKILLLLNCVYQRSRTMIQWSVMQGEFRTRVFMPCTVTKANQHFQTQQYVYPPALGGYFCSTFCARRKLLLKIATPLMWWFKQLLVLHPSPYKQGAAFAAQGSGCRPQRSTILPTPGFNRGTGSTRLWCWVKEA